MPPAWMTAPTMLVADHTKDNVPQWIYVAIIINILNFISINIVKNHPVATKRSASFNYKGGYGYLPWRVLHLVEK